MNRHFEILDSFGDQYYFFQLNFSAEFSLFADIVKVRNAFDTPDWRGWSRIEPAASTTNGQIR